MLKNNKNQAIMHGENLIVPATLPKNAKEIKHTGSFIFAHSETGHNHVIEAPKAANFRIFQAEDGTVYFQILDEATIIHKKNFDIHEPVKVKEGTYKVFRKQEYDPFTKMIGAVRD